MNPWCVEGDSGLRERPEGAVGREKALRGFGGGCGVAAGPGGALRDSEGAVGLVGGLWVL